MLKTLFKPTSITVFIAVLIVVILPYHIEASLKESQYLDTLTVVAVGDIMLGSAYPSKQTLPPNNRHTELLSNVREDLQSGDITFGNLEGALTNNLSGVKQCNTPSNCYAFAMPTYYAKELKRSGFNLLSIANNHTGDFGDRGRVSTIKALKTNDIHHAGLVIAKRDTFTVNGLKIGFTAFSPNVGTNDIHNVKRASNIVANLKAISDVVIVSFHGGAEGPKHKHITRKNEIHLGQSRGNVYHFAHAMIDAGADIILGHGPHVTRAIELYKDRFIAYSMGNFLTYSQINISGLNGIAPIFKLKIASDGTFLSGKIIPTKQQPQKGVIIDSKRSVIKELKVLTKQDFPKTPIIISDTGEILRL